MNFKKKLETTKDKIKQNAPVIIATVSTGVAAGIAIACHIAKLNLEAEHAKEMLNRCDGLMDETHIHTTLDSEAKLASGLNARFTHPDLDFDLIVQKADPLTKN